MADSAHDSVRDETEPLPARREAVTAAREVAVVFDNAGYPMEPPYSPSEDYPEYPFDAGTRAGPVNPAYEGVRRALRLIGSDADRYGERDWNPLGHLIRRGNTVVLKPNFIREYRESRPGHGDCLITHGSLIRAVVDYVYIALEGHGRILIADAPQNDADFDNIRHIAGLDEIRAFYHENAGFEIEVYDLRPERAKNVAGITVGHEPLSGDPRGYVRVDLGRNSMLAEVEQFCHLLYGSEYDVGETRRHHGQGVHEYLISQTILQAHCVINLPKLKTHKKTGITVCMKNLVGINGNKNWLPHHRMGPPARGGDQFAENGAAHCFERGVMACFRRLFPWLGPLRTLVAQPLKTAGQRLFGNTNTDTVRSGNWYGNDTTWRMVIDLNRILMYADENGRLRDAPVRHTFCIVDGIVGGEGNGPLDPTPKAAGVVVAGANPVAVDLACARLMGFDYAHLPLLQHAFSAHALPLTGFAPGQVVFRSVDTPGVQPLLNLDARGLHFRPHFGWQGHVELDPAQILANRCG